MKRSGIGVGAKSRERGSTFKAKRPRKRLTTPKSAWLAVQIRDRFWCVWCHHEGRVGTTEHPHHLLPKQTWPIFFDTLANIVGVCGRCHMTHEFSPRNRLPWEALPQECRDFLTEVAHVDARAARLIAVKYPKSNERES